MEYDVQHLDTILHSLGGVVWEASRDMRHFFFVSDQLTEILGETPTQWVALADCWIQRVHPDDRHIISAYKKVADKRSVGRVFTYRMVRANGQIVWIRDIVSAIKTDEGVVVLNGVMLDVSVTGRLQALEQLEQQVLRLNSDLNISLREVLQTYLKGLESIFPQIYFSIHRIINGRLDIGVAPSLPADYLTAINGLPVGGPEGSCGSLVATAKQVIVADIATHPSWEKCRELAMAHGLRACWSSPIINNDDKIVATLAMYYKEPKVPEDDEISVIAKTTALLHVIMENRQKTEELRETNLLMLQSQELAHFGNWHWDVQGDLVTWSPALYKIYGLDPESFKATFAGYQELLHPDDRAMVYQAIEHVLQTGEDGSFVERILRPDGEIRYLRSWAKLKRDATGRPLDMIGACLDITESVLQRKSIEQQNKQLLDIAWTQSHVIRVPLSRIMSLTDLLQDEHDQSTETHQLLEHLRASAAELDRQVRLICKKTESLDI
jgi:PAS domain S-box-containing protein